MIKNSNILCISSIDWDFVWQGHQEIMSAFAKNGNKVLFIENTGIRAPNFKDIPRIHKRIINWLKSVKGFREVKENLFVYSPIILPFPYSRLSGFINKYLLLRPLKRWMKAAEFHDPIIWTFLPTTLALSIAESINHKLLIYYCIADFSKLVKNQQKLKRAEGKLISKCDLIFAQGQVIADECKKFNNEVYVFPFGVTISNFSMLKENEPQVRDELKGIKRPIIGYVGGIHKHIDFELIKFISEERMEYSIVLVGPVQTDISAIKDLRNVFTLGQKDFSLLPYYIREFSACIIPYEKSKYTETVFPTKLNEYHALGKPVISTDLPEVMNFNKENDNLVFIASNKRDFLDKITQALNNDSDILCNKRVISARKNSWQYRIEKMSSIIEKKIIDKSLSSREWKSKFLVLYARVRKLILQAALISVFLYFIVFYTPLVWFLASPLKVAPNLHKADAIVVFAGGVGEGGGKAGQSYDERAGAAIDLFKLGFAGKIVFSSAQIYKFKEVEIMETLAESLGVPDQDIYLEDKAINTYQNAVFTSEILKKHGWKKIILVSSPYNMRRALGVFKKQAPNITVYPASVTSSKFYQKPKDQIKSRTAKQINLRQIKALFHEFKALIYYKWKGYL